MLSQTNPPPPFQHAYIYTKPLANIPKLSGQFTGAFNYINLNAPEGHFPNHSIPPPTADASQQPTQASSTNPTQSQAPTFSTAEASNSTTDGPSERPAAVVAAAIPRPASPATFTAAQKELAEDIMTKTKQINDLLDRLPGLDRSQEAQEARIAELEEELKSVEVERKVALGEREKAIELLEGVISGIRR